MGTYTPTLEGFTAWIYGSGMGVPTQWLPVDDANIPLVYELSLETVLPLMGQIAPAVYMTMVYNLGGHYLAMFAQDPVPLPDPPFITVDGVAYGFWSYLRKTSGLNGFTSGLVTGSSDEGTSVSLAQPDWASKLTAGQLQLTNSPWGRVYLSFAQSAGTVWGLS